MGGACVTRAASINNLLVVCILISVSADAVRFRLASKAHFADSRYAGEHARIDDQGLQARE
jgi:hypothetical protein